MTFATIRARLDGLSGAGRVALVGGGYLVALLAASLAVLALVHVTSGPDRDAAPGMAAFADALLFLAVLAAGSVGPTCLGLYFLRWCVAPWRILVVLGMAGAPTGLLAVWSVARCATEGVWPMVAVPRVLVSPLLFGVLVLAGAFAPDRSWRKWLLVAAGIECLTCGYGFLHWYAPALFR